MDGATKFVKGDAIAGIIIIIVNILGGFVIGVLQRGMTLVQALQTYTLLTVGDGLVVQIPALLSPRPPASSSPGPATSSLGRDVSSRSWATTECC